MCSELTELEAVTVDNVQQADECLGKVGDMMEDIGADVQHEINMVASLFLFRFTVPPLANHGRHQPAGLGGGGRRGDRQGRGARLHPQQGRRQEDREGDDVLR